MEFIPKELAATLAVGHKHIYNLQTLMVAEEVVPILPDWHVEARGRKSHLIWSLRTDRKGGRAAQAEGTVGGKV